MKDRYNLDGPFDLGELKRCEAQRNGRGLTKNCCRWCDRKIAESARESLSHKRPAYSVAESASDDRISAGR
jgi:hypothetical protein